MSHTFYDSPDHSKAPISIDVTNAYCWFFQHGKDDEQPYVIVPKTELPAIWIAMGTYLGYLLENHTPSSEMPPEYQREE